MKFPVLEKIVDLLKGASWGVQPITVNIDICPFTLVFVENIGHKYDFQGVAWSLIGYWGGGGPDPKKKSFNRILIHIYLQLMFRLSFQSNAYSFNMKCMHI